MRTAQYVIKYQAPLLGMQDRTMIRSTGISSGNKIHKDKNGKLSVKLTFVRTYNYAGMKGYSQIV